MQFPHLFSSPSRRKPGLMQEMSIQQDQDPHKIAFNNDKHHYPRITLLEKCNTNETVGSSKKKNKTKREGKKTALQWNRGGSGQASTATEVTLGYSLAEKDNNHHNNMAYGVAPPGAVESTKNLIGCSSTVASAHDRKGGRAGGVVGKLLQLTKKTSHRRQQQQRSRASAASSAASSPSSAAFRHESVTMRTCLSSSICTNMSASLMLSDHHHMDLLASTTFTRQASPSPLASRSGPQQRQEQHSAASSSSDAQPGSCIQEQQQDELDSSSLPATADSFASCTTAAPTTYLLQKHEYSELGYMHFHYSMDEADENNASSSSCSSVLQEARTKASLTQKPILIVHAVVPNGDVDAGLDIFSHPLVVEAAQSLFVAVFCKTTLELQQQPKCRSRVSFWHCSHDNDASSEQTPIDLVPCIQGDTLTLSSVVSGMIQALEAFHAPSIEPLSSESSSSSSLVIPKYLLLLQEEASALPRTRTCLSSSSLSSSSSSSSSLSCNQCQTKTAVFGMDDSHLGEVEFAGCHGVLATLAGHYHGGGLHEPKQQQQQQHVVQVSYDSRLLSYCSLVRYALQRRVGQIIYYQTNDERVAATMECDRIRSSSSVRKLESSSPVQDSIKKCCRGDHSRNKDTTTTRAMPFSCIVPDYDPKRALRKTPLKYVPLTSLQATRANRLVHYGRFDEAMHLLSPQQGLILMQKAMRTSTNKDMHEMVDIPILHAWLCVCEQVHPKVKEMNDMSNNEASLEEDEDTNEWGGRCFE